MRMKLEMGKKRRRELKEAQAFKKRAKKRVEEQTRKEGCPRSFQWDARLRETKIIRRAESRSPHFVFAPDKRRDGVRTWRAGL